MKQSVAVLSLALAVAPGMALAQHAHGGHADHAAHAGHEAQAPGTADQAPWTPDAALTEGMRRVRGAVETLAHLEMGHLGEGQVVTVAGDADAAIEYMFANCELPPEPDIALHGILARLMAATRDLHAKPADPAPVATMRAALAEYARLFDDPGLTSAPGTPRR